MTICEKLIAHSYTTGTCPKFIVHSIEMSHAKVIIMILYSAYKIKDRPVDFWFVCNMISMATYNTFPDQILPQVSWSIPSQCC